MLLAGSAQKRKDEQNTVFHLLEGERVTCYHCVRAQEDAEYGQGEAFLAGPGHSPYDGEAHHICRHHLDSDAVIYEAPKPAA